MLTDDPGTPGSAVWEINVAYLEQRTGTERVRSVPHADFNYGVGDRIQLKYETGWLFVTTQNGGTKNGLDDSLLGVKWRFLDQSPSGADMSVYPQLQLENPTSSAARGVAQQGPNLFLPVELSHDFGQVKLVGEFGYQYFHSQEDQWVLGLLGAVEASDSLELMAEVRGFGDKPLSRGDWILNFGLRWGFSSSFKLLASMGTGVSSGPQTTSYIAYLGIQVTLGEDKKETSSRRLRTVDEGR